MKSINKLLLVLLILLATASRAIAGGDINSEKPDHIFGTRSYMSNQCLLTDTPKDNSQEVAPFVAAIGSALLTKGIDYIITSISDDLKKIRKEESTSKIDFYLYKYAHGDSETFSMEKYLMKYPALNENFKCITTITGLFKKSSPGSKVFAEGYAGDIRPVGISFGSENEKEQIKSRLEKNNITFEGGADGIHGIHEVKLDFADDESAFRLENKFLAAYQFMKKRSKVGLSYKYTLSGPGSSPNSNDYAVAAINFGELSEGKVMHGEGLKKNQFTGWIKRIGMTPESFGFFFRNHFGQQTGDCSDDKKDCVQNYMPVLLSVKNTQTKKPSDSAKLIAGILSASKEAFTAAATEKFFPDKDAAEAATLDAEIAVQTAFNTLDAATEDGLMTLATLQVKKACRALAAAQSTNQSMADRCKDHLK